MLRKSIRTGIENKSEKPEMKKRRSPQIHDWQDEIHRIKKSSEKYRKKTEKILKEFKEASSKLQELKSAKKRVDPEALSTAESFELPGMSHEGRYRSKIDGKFLDYLLHESDGSNCQL